MRAARALDSLIHGLFVFIYGAPELDIEYHSSASFAIIALLMTLFLLFYGYMLSFGCALFRRVVD